jgi:hypothetical protein
MADERNTITGILDWEWVGWYPDYWEYAQIMRPAFEGDFNVDGWDCTPEVGYKWD